MKRLLIIIFIIFLAGCSQVEFYDEYTSRLNLELPRPKEVRLGSLVEALPKDYEDFDLIFTFDENTSIEDKDFWEVLTEEERYEVIEALYNKYKLGIGKTIEDKKVLLERLLNLDLDEGMVAFYKSSQTEDILLLRTNIPSDLYMLRVVHD